MVNHILFLCNYSLKLEKKRKEILQFPLKRLSLFHLQQERRRKWRHFSHRITFSNPMLEPLKERTRDTCETHIRGGPPEATGLSQVTQRGYSVSASPVFSSSAVQRITTLWNRNYELYEFWENIANSPLPEPSRLFKCSFTGPRSSNARTVPCLNWGLHSRFWVAPPGLPRPSGPQASVSKPTLSAKQEP